MVEGTIHVDFGVMAKAVSVLREQSSQLEGAAAKAGGAELSVGAFGLMNVMLGSAVAPFADLTTQLIGAGGEACTALSERIRVASENFQDVEAGVRQQYTQAQADLDGQQVLLS